MVKPIQTLLVICLILVASLAGCNEETKTTNHQEEKNQIIKDTLKVGEKGKTLNSGRFGINSKDSEIKKRWGKPTDSDPHYLVYQNKHIEFGLENGNVIRILSYDPKIKQLTLDEIIKTAGKPHQDRKYLGKRTIIYNVGKYELNFVFNGTKKTDKVAASLILEKGKTVCPECQNRDVKPNSETNLKIHPDPKMKLPTIPESETESEMEKEAP